MTDLTGEALEAALNDFRGQYYSAKFDLEMKISEFASITFDKLPAFKAYMFGYEGQGVYDFENLDPIEQCFPRFNRHDRDGIAAALLNVYRIRNWNNENVYKANVIGEEFLSENSGWKPWLNPSIFADLNAKYLQFSNAWNLSDNVSSAKLLQINNLIEELYFYPSSNPEVLDLIISGPHAQLYSHLEDSLKFHYDQSTFEGVIGYYEAIYNNAYSTLSNYQNGVDDNNIESLSNAYSALSTELSKLNEAFLSIQSIVNNMNQDAQLTSFWRKYWELCRLCSLEMRRDPNHPENIKRDGFEMTKDTPPWDINDVVLFINSNINKHIEQFFAVDLESYRNIDQSELGVNLNNFISTVKHRFETDLTNFKIAPELFNTNTSLFKYPEPQPEPVTTVPTPSPPPPSPEPSNNNGNSNMKTWKIRRHTDSNSTHEGWIISHVEGYSCTAMDHNVHISIQPPQKGSWRLEQTTFGNDALLPGLTVSGNSYQFTLHGSHESIVNGCNHSNNNENNNNSTSLHVYLINNETNNPHKMFSFVVENGCLQNIITNITITIDNEQPDCDD